MQQLWRDVHPVLETLWHHTAVQCLWPAKVQGQQDIDWMPL